MKRTLVIQALLLLAASAAAQTAPAPTKNPVSTALRDILPGRQRNTVAAVEAMPTDKFNYKPSIPTMVRRLFEMLRIATLSRRPAVVVHYWPECFS